MKFKINYWNIISTTTSFKSSIFPHNKSQTFPTADTTMAQSCQPSQVQSPYPSITTIYMYIWTMGQSFPFQLFLCCCSHLWAQSGSVVVVHHHLHDKRIFIRTYPTLRAYSLSGPIGAFVRNFQKMWWDVATKSPIMSDCASLFRVKMSKIRHYSFGFSQNKFEMLLHWCRVTVDFSNLFQLLLAFCRVWRR